MPSHLSVEIFEREFKSFMEDWEKWDERFTENHNSESIMSAYNLFVEVWKLWFDRLIQTDDGDTAQVLSSKDIQPTFERISPIFKVFQIKWISFNEKYSAEPVFKTMSEKHANLYNKAQQVMDNIEATLEKKTHL